MPVSTPSLASHVVPIPYLSPHWGALLEGQVSHAAAARLCPMSYLTFEPSNAEQDESVLPNPRDMLDIFSEVAPLNMCVATCMPAT